MGRSGQWLLATGAGLPVLLARAGDLHESDTFWQVRTGELILDRHRLPTVDPFSWTAAGRPWALNSWLFDVLLGAAYRLGGLPAVALFAALVGLLGTAALVLLARELGATPAASGLAAAVASIALIDWLGGRPQLADYAAVPALLVLLLRWHRPVLPPRRPCSCGAGCVRFCPALSPPQLQDRRGLGVLAAIGGLHVLWVNLHSSAPLGVGLCAAFAAAHVLGGRRSMRGHPPVSGPRGGERRWVRVVAPTVVAGVSVLVNPWGVGVLARGAAVRRESAGLVQEWGPPDLTEWSQVLPLIVAIAGCALASCAARPRGAGRRGGRAGAPVPATDRTFPVGVALCAVGLTGVGGLMLRFVPVAAVVGAAVIAVALSSPRVRAWAAERRVVLGGGAVAGVAALSALAVPALTHLGRPEVEPRLLDALPSGCRLLNEYILGGHVILRRPDVPVSLDSRNDVYGAAEVRRLQGAFDVPDERTMRGVTCVLSRTDRRLAEVLRDDPGWRTAATGGGVVIYVRA
ncbi:hypothetical protein Val02_77440 [Virgisporangium aliadipatigenens]|uniref:Uncharacterized protein n=1 Tax=Virgisporangium aliadipatigenens TaxID=741659 RepID=A0A8J3YW96_9ACTN|nr:hypothetical protein [Virgisporangium aliadipatigenens]GIJ50858.1 hypothetical protein Val02_77440 [Virgisporangium aliadipatigenens]